MALSTKMSQLGHYETIRTLIDIITQNAMRSDTSATNGKYSVFHYILDLFETQWSTPSYYLKLVTNFQPKVPHTTI
jgi:hypothetical protein